MLLSRRQRCYFSFHVRNTVRADTMARIARNSAPLALPADAPRTPGTCDQEIAIPHRRELLLELSVLCLQRAMPFDPFVSPLEHSGNLSSSQVCERGKTLKKALSFLQDGASTHGDTRCPYPSHLP